MMLLMSVKIWTKEVGFYCYGIYLLIKFCIFFVGRGEKKRPEWVLAVVFVMHWLHMKQKLFEVLIPEIVHKFQSV